MHTENWVVMPCFNEEKNISKTIDDVKKFCQNLVVVDDGSVDKTYPIAESRNDNVLKHAVNLGKGAALKTGIEFALQKGAKKIVFIDSDGQHKAKEIPRFFKLLDKYDIVFGSRKLDKQMPTMLRIGNFVLSSMISIFFGIKLNDTQSGYRGIRTDAYDKIIWKAKDYSVETEMIANSGRNNLKYKEIFIKTFYENKYKGTTVIDGIKIGFKIIFYRLRRLI